MGMPEQEGSVFPVTSGELLPAYGIDCPPAQGTDSPHRSLPAALSTSPPNQTHTELCVYTLHTLHYTVLVLRNKSV